MDFSSDIPVAPRVQGLVGSFVVPGWYDVAWVSNHEFVLARCVAIERLVVRSRFGLVSCPLCGWVDYGCFVAGSGRPLASLRWMAGIRHRAARVLCGRAIQAACMEWFD